MTRIINKRGLSKDTTKRKGGKTSGSNHASHQLCKRCSRRFGSKACPKRLCGSCCPLYAGGGHGAQCVAHLSLRRAAKRRQGAYLLVASVNRLQRAESKERKRSKKQKHLAKRIKTLTTTQECSDVDDDDEEGAEMEVVPQDDHGDDGVAATLEALVAVQAEEIARLRRELKLTRHAHDRLKRKHVKVEQGLCIICEERSLNVLLVPCGHCYCRECVAPLRSCPVCRTAIRKQHSYHPPAYVCDSAVLTLVPPLPSSAKPVEEDDDYSDSSSSSSSAPPSPEDTEFVLRRRSAANPHRVLFV